MLSKPIEPPKLNEQKISEFNESVFISFIIEFLNTLFKLALLNFKNSKFTLDKNFQALFDENNKNNMKEFESLVTQLSQELNSIKNYLDSNSEDIDFKSNDINMEILIESTNDCYLLCQNYLNIDELVNKLIQIFNNLINKKKIKANNNSNVIITQFQNYINCYLNYIDKIKDAANSQVKFEEKKNDETQINEYIIKIKKLEEEIQNYDNALNQKQIEIEEEKKKSAELNQILTKKSIEPKLDKLVYDEIKNSLMKELNNKFDESMKNMEKKHSEELKNLVQRHSVDIAVLDTKIEALKKENKMKDKKLEKLLELVGYVRSDMNKLADIIIGLSEELDKTVDMLDNVKYIVDNYELELDNLDNLFG